MHYVFLFFEELASRRTRKIADIRQALSVNPVDVSALRRMAISEGGLLTDEIRCQVWPWLLNVPPHVLEQEPGIITIIILVLSSGSIAYATLLLYLTITEHSHHISKSTAANCCWVFFQKP